MTCQHSKVCMHGKYFFSNLIKTLGILRSKHLGEALTEIISFLEAVNRGFITVFVSLNM